MESKGFLLKLSLKSFYYFFCYTEHFRLTKYNEYIITHVCLSKNIFNFLLRNEYITLYYNWQQLDSSLAAGYVQGYRKGLLGKFYLPCEVYFFREVRMKFLFTTLEYRLLCFDQSFILLNLLNKNKKIRKFFFRLNRQAMRHNLRVLAYAQIMKKDRK
jgi:hypothetical protein